MVKYDKEEKRLIIPADINYYSLEEYKRGYQEGYEDGYASGITACTPDYSKEYLTIEALETGDFYVRKANIGYSVNEGEWETTTGVTTLALNRGDTVRFKGTSWGMSLFSGNTLAFNVYGNVESLKYSDDFEDKTNITMSGVRNLFKNSSGLVDASNLILPATTLLPNCYIDMFNGCTNLTKAPELPATTLAQNCYQWMFSGCTSLTTAPELPATTLPFACYATMFAGCTSLTTAPALPATTLGAACYSGMFEGCTSLTEAPELPATTLAGTCYTEMFKGCTSITAAPSLPATTLTDHCYSMMFEGCTSLTSAPELPATTLAGTCYFNMFAGCSSLTTAPALPATTLAEVCYNQMFLDCTSLTKAPELPATTLVNRCYNGMFRGCTSIDYIKCLATDISAEYCTLYWVNDVAPTGTFETPSTTAWTTGTDGIPYGWTRVDI